MPAPIESANAKDRYLNSDKKVDIKSHLNKMEQEEKSGLKGIDVRETPKQLGKDDFLRLLITQMSQQDPTNPLKDQDFIAQMAQFTSLEQMKNIATGISRMEAKQSYMLIGKFVSGPDLVTGDTVSGVAGAVFFDADGKSFVRVNGRTISVEKVNFIADPSIMDQGNTQKPAVEAPASTEKVETKSPSEVNTNPVEKAWDYPGKPIDKQKSYDKR